MQLATLRESFDGQQFASGEHWNQRNATIERAPHWVTLRIGVENRHSARAAVTFVTTALRPN
jgi:hypothetical protein